jgi:soluble lytic murein transglycosylase-like protein
MREYGTMSAKETSIMALPAPKPCPGYATWETLPNMQTQVTYQGKTWIPQWSETISEGKTYIGRLKKAWEMYGPMIERATAGSPFPTPWFMGILCAESLGNINACSPCEAKSCTALYPNCQPCCAYGIMQITNDTAQIYGKTSGQSLMGNPELSFKVANNIFVKRVGEYGMNLPMIAGSYNAGSFPGKYGCGNGRTNMFGNGENDGYTQRVVTFANTAVALGIGSSSSLPSSISLANVAGIGLMAAAAYLYWNHVRH